jgi:hypothetical protein
MRELRVLGVVAVLATILSSAAVAARGDLGFLDWEWTLVNDDAPWARRAGLQVVELRDRLYLMGGRTPLQSPIPGASIIWDDVWASDDHGKNWRPLVGPGEEGIGPLQRRLALARRGALGSGDRLGRLDASAGTPVCGRPRPVRVLRRLWPSRSPLAPPANPSDVWVSRTGAFWEQVSDSPWNATSPDSIKYDFDALVVNGRRGPAILTFGGDRETFNFGDPLNYLRVDNDVWRFSAPGPRR